MKLKILLLFSFIFCLYTIGIVKASTLPLLGKVIYLDPGHGGKDPGAISGDLRESDLNLAITIKLQEELEKNGAIVYLTRYGDYDLSTTTIQRKRSDLSRRANIINDSGADVYLSIHLNADVSSKWQGAQIFYDDVNENNKELASIIQKSLKEDLNTTRNYKKINNHYMYQRISVKGILIEAGFITNPNERYLLKQTDYQIKLSKSITKGIINYFAK